MRETITPASPDYVTVGATMANTFKNRCLDVMRKCALSGPQQAQQSQQPQAQHIAHQHPQRSMVRNVLHHDVAVVASIPTPHGSQPAATTTLKPHTPM